MSQIDILTIFPSLIWFIIGILLFYFIIISFIIPNLYYILRIRSIFILELLNFFFEKIHGLYLLKKFIMKKFFFYKIDKYIHYLYKKLKK